MKKGHSYIRPQDVSRYMQQRKENRIEVSPSGVCVYILRQGDDVEKRSQYKAGRLFIPPSLSRAVPSLPPPQVYFQSGAAKPQFTRAIVIAEIIRKKSVEDVVEETLRRHRGKEQGKKPPQCEVCGMTDKSQLQRCSRCKTTWYCGRSHQVEDWSRHEKTCLLPHEQASKRLSEETLSRGNGQSGTSIGKGQQGSAASGDQGEIGVDEGIEIEGSIMSLQCPLSLSRIEEPVKGKQCKHARCFDLSSFLYLSAQSWVWQCPICDRPISPHELQIDEPFRKVLKDAPEVGTSHPFSLSLYFLSLCLPASACL